MASPSSVESNLEEGSSPKDDWAKATPRHDRNKENSNPPYDKILITMKLTSIRFLEVTWGSRSSKPVALITIVGVITTTRERDASDDHVHSDPCSSSSRARSKANGSANLSAEVSTIFIRL